MDIDHVLVAVRNLEAAGRDMEMRHGLASIEGGTHPAWGTANRIVPLVDSYLELIAIVDPDKAADSVFGRWVASGVSETIMPLGCTVLTLHLDEIARRLHRAVHAGSRTAPGGDRCRWQI